MDLVWATEPWAQDYINASHYEALQHWGERVVLRLAWTSIEFGLGLVARCQHCQQVDTIANPTNLNVRLASLYDQPGSSECTYCFGQGFEGGFQPTGYITWMLAQDTPFNRRLLRSGEEVLEEPQTQFMPTPRLKMGDLIIRVRQWDETRNPPVPLVQENRYVLGTVNYESLRDGAGLGQADVRVMNQTAQLHKMPTGSILQTVPPVLPSA